MIPEMLSLLGRGCELKWVMGRESENIAVEDVIWRIIEELNQCSRSAGRAVECWVCVEMQIQQSDAKEELFFICSLCVKLTSWSQLVGEMAETKESRSRK
jgi:hypothetical protein